MPTINYNYLPQFAPGTYHPVFDPTGLLPANLVTGEVHTITAVNGRDFHFIVPLFAPFFAYAGAATLTYIPATGPQRVLVEGVDYLACFEFIGASRGCSKPVYGGFSLLNTQLAGQIQLSYRTIGGNWCLSLPEITEILANRVNNPRVIAWEQVTNYPNRFPVIDHEWDLVDMVGMSAVVEKLGDVATAIANRPVPILPIDFASHLTDFANPHQTTKQQVGLGLANNYATATNAETIAGTATNLHVTPAGAKALVDQAQGDVSLEIQAHIGDKSNPHETTQAQVGLGKVSNFELATVAEARAGVAQDRYLTPYLVWQEILAAFGAGNLDITGRTGTFSGTLSSGGQIRAANGAGANANHGFSFNGEGAFDSGMFSPSDNVIDFYSAGVLQMRVQEAAQAVQMFKKVQGATLGMAMVQNDGTNNGSFTARASGGGDYALAGMAFHNDSYGIKLGVRADGYFGLGGWSRPGWSMYSDPSGNFTVTGNLTGFSDPRLKENVQIIEGAVALLGKLDGVYFTWKHGIPHVDAKAGKHDLGVLADQVNKIFPQIVSPSISLEGESYLTVAYEKLTPVLIQAVKELDERLKKAEEHAKKAFELAERWATQFERMQSHAAALDQRLIELGRGQ